MVLDPNSSCTIQSPQIPDAPGTGTPKANLNLAFSKSKNFSEEEINDTSISSPVKGAPEEKDPQTNRYHVNLKKNEILTEKKRLKNFMYGPIILIARNKKEYYKIMNFRRYRIFKLETIREIEAKYTAEDKYFEAVKDFKRRIENYNEKNIRGFLKFFYFEE